MSLLVLELLRTVPDQPISAVAQQLLDRAEVGLLASVAEFHGVLPLVGRMARQWDLPSVVVTALTRGRFEQLLRHQITLEDLALFGGRLDEAAIPWAVVKGPVLAGHCYPHPDMRFYSDLDLLVPPSRFPEALSVLEAAGAELLDQNWTLARRQVRGEMNLLSRSGTVIDLHWHLLNEPADRDRFSLDTTRLLDRRVRVPVGPDGAWTLDPEDSLLHLSLHAVLSGLKRFVWLADIRAATRTMQPRAGTLESRAEESGLSLVLAIALSRTARILDEPDLLALASTGRSGWLRLLHGLERWRPPEIHAMDRYSLAGLVACTGPTSTRSITRGVAWSAREAARRLAQRPWPRGDAPAGATEPATNPLHEARGDPRDRARYMDLIQREADR